MRHIRKRYEAFLSLYKLRPISQSFGPNYENMLFCFLFYCKDLSDSFKKYCLEYSGTMSWLYGICSLNTVNVYFKFYLKHLFCFFLEIYMNICSIALNCNLSYLIIITVIPWYGRKVVRQSNSDFNNDQFVSEKEKPTNNNNFIIPLNECFAKVCLQNDYK